MKENEEGTVILFNRELMICSSNIWMS